MSDTKRRRPGKGPIPRGGETARREAASARRKYLLKHGTPAERNAASLPYQGSMDFMERFWVRVGVASDTECWLWLGQTDKRPGQGYGMLTLFGRGFRAHRIAYELATGVELSSDTVGCHHCDNPPCVNPSHLFRGSPADNMHDCIAKGRAHRPTHCVRGHPRIEENLYPPGKNGGRQCRLCSDIRNRSKPRVERPKGWRISPEDVPTIRARAASGERHADIAAAYGVARRTIGMVISGITWKRIA